MNTFARVIVFGGILLCIALLHTGIRLNTASLVLAPVVLSLFIASFTPSLIVLSVITALVFETMSTLPFGVMIIIFLMPYIASWVFKKPPTDLTWKYFFVNLTACTAQIAIMLVAKYSIDGNSLFFFPVQIVTLQIICSTFIAYGIAVAYHEYATRL